MVFAVDTVCKVVKIINGYVGPTLGIEDVDVIFKGLNLRYKNQVDSKCSRKVVRLMQLGFLRGFRWHPASINQHFGMLDNVNVKRVEKFKCRCFSRDGVLHYA